MIGIVCLGNPLHGDDAVGYHAYQRLSQSIEAQHLHFAGSALLDVVNFIERYDKLIIIDSYAPAGSPGSVRYALIDTQSTG